MAIDPNRRLHRHSQLERQGLSFAIGPTFIAEEIHLSHLIIVVANVQPPMDRPLWSEMSFQTSSSSRMTKILVSGLRTTRALRLHLAATCSCSILTP